MKKLSARALYNHEKDSKKTQVFRRALKTGRGSAEVML